MTTKIGINGFGRIGRLVVRAMARSKPDLERLVELRLWGYTVGDWIRLVEPGKRELVYDEICQVLLLFLHIDYSPEFCRECS